MLVAGRAEGDALVLDEPLSLWGGLDAATGVIVEARHPQHGESMTGRVLVMPAGRGSSSSSSVLAEAIRLRTAPAAVLLGEPDEIVAVGSLVASLLYELACPVAVLAAADYARVRTGDRVAIAPAGAVRVSRAAHRPG